MEDKKSDDQLTINRTSRYTDMLKAALPRCPSIVLGIPIALKRNYQSKLMCGQYHDK